MFPLKTYVCDAVFSYFQREHKSVSDVIKTKLTFLFKSDRVALRAMTLQGCITTGLCTA